MPTHHTEDVPDTDIAWVMPQYGAYLVHWVYPGTEEMTDIELFTAASSLAKAKRIARGNLPDEVKGPYRWTKEDNHWTLSGTYVNEWKTYEEEY